MTTKVLTTLNKGEVVYLQWAGGGGYGDPLDRNPAFVLQDVIEEKIGLKRARDIYGVVLNMEQRQVDRLATARLRQQMRQQKRS